MYLERLTLTNFQCFGPASHTITFDEQLTALLGVNGTGKTAACQALLRLFSVVTDQRQVRRNDFHVPDDEVEAPPHRTMSVDAVFAFPELTNDESDARDAVPEFFAQMTADDNGELKLRIVLEASWSDAGSVNGTIETSRRVVYSFEADYADKWIELRGSDLNRIQMVYVPATRDGARQVNSFLRGRLWRASQWSDPFRNQVTETAEQLTGTFRDEAVVEAVTQAITARWRQLHHVDTEQTPLFQPINPDISVLVTNAELRFEPSPTGRTRSASELSDGQQSLLHIALTSAALDLESEIAGGTHDSKFDITAASLPFLTLLAIEEPENNLAPYFLSRVVRQLHEVTSSGRAQSLISSHSASAMSRIQPEQIRHFRLDETTATARVSEIALPEDATEAGKYIREAVHAYPELYFARFVVLCEGDSEELVLPRLAAARGLHIDQSFVAVVPLGGRHTNHFWRLLKQLGIPHATLLDLDYGRPGGGEGRIRDACKRLVEIGQNPFDGSDAIKNFSSIGDIENLPIAELEEWMNHLETWNIFFSTPLDLDLLLLRRFPDAYRGSLEAGKQGPSSHGDPRAAVLGAPEDRPAIEYWEADERTEELRWYRYLFLGQSKPSTHLRALAYVEASELADPPKRLGRLLDLIERSIGAT